jgi:hypothetical protein
MHHLDAHLIGDGSWVACVDGNPTSGGNDHSRTIPASAIRETLT